MTTKGIYSLISIYIKVSGISILTIDKANSKNLIIKDMFEHIDIDVDNEESIEVIATIAWDLTKNSLTTTVAITVTITRSISGEVTGLSLFPSSGLDISLICSELPSISADNSNAVTCTPNAHLTTAETFTLVASYSSIGGFNILIVDENAKTFTINPDYTGVRLLL